MSAKKLLGVFCIALALQAASTLQDGGNSGKDTRLAQLAMQGDRDAVRALLKQKVDVNVPQGDGMTALHWAANRNDVDMAKALLAAGANVKAVTRIEELTPLALACTNGNAPMVDLLLKGGAGANEGNGLWTPLMLASSSGSAEAVKLLLDHGADVNVKETSHHQTALMFAAGRNRDAVIPLLAAHGADLNATSDVIELAKVSVDENGNKLPAATGGTGNGGGREDRAAARVMGGMTAMHLRHAITRKKPSALSWKQAPTLTRSARAIKARRL